MAVDDLVTPKEICAVLRIERSTFWARLEEGKIPPPYINLSPRMRRWRREEIEGWIAAGCPSAKEWAARKGQREKAGAK